MASVGITHSQGHQSFQVVWLQFQAPMQKIKNISQYFCSQAQCLNCVQNYPCEENDNHHCCSFENWGWTSSYIRQPLGLLSREENKGHINKFEWNNISLGEITSWLSVLMQLNTALNRNIKTHYRKIIIVMLLFWSSHFMYKNSMIFTSPPTKNVGSLAFSSWRELTPIKKTSSLKDRPEKVAGM